jgi:hypothetical protein
MAENIKQTLFQEYRIIYKHSYTLSALKLSIDPINCYSRVALNNLTTIYEQCYYCYEIS